MKSSNTSSETSDQTIAPSEPIPDDAKVHQILKWVLSGASEFEIAEAVAVQWPGSDIRPLLANVICQLVEAGEPTHILVLGWCIEATKYLYQRMVDIGDFAGALRAIKQIADLTQSSNRYGSISPTDRTTHSRHSPRITNRSDTGGPRQTLQS